jgi:hypothetical protein
MKKITETRKRKRKRNRNRKRKRKRETRKNSLKNKAGMLSNSYVDKTQPIVMKPIILFKSQNYKFK